MAAPAILKLDIIADATKAAAALNKTGTQAKTTSQKLLGLGQAVAGAFVVREVVQFGTAAVKAAQESEVATERLRTVFASMGDETGKAAAAAEKYAAALSRKIGVDDEAIMAAQAQLATFKDVSSETARTAGIFDRATAAAADLAAAGFGTLDSNSVQLGKALQDPTKGLTALARSGVTFTESQKAQIKAMQQSGDLLGAQKVVLKAVEGQVKGTAAATATSSQKMGVAFGEVQESIGRALLPALEALAPILAKVAAFIEKNISWILPLAAAFAVWAAVTWVLTAATTAFGVSLAISVGWIALIVVAIAAVIAAVVLAYQKVGWFRAGVQAAFAIISGIFRAWWAYVTTVFAAVSASFNVFWNVIKTVFNWIKSNWPLLLAVLTGPIGVAVALILTNWSKIKNAATDLYNWVKGKFDALVGAISAAAGALDRIVDGIITAIKAPINAVIRAWNSFKFPTFDIPKISTPIGDIGGGSWGGWHLPHITELATGGTVLRSGLAVVHRGETFSGVGRSLGGNTVINVHVTPTGLGADSPQIQRQLVAALRGYVARNGPLNVPVRTVT